MRILRFKNKILEKLVDIAGYGILIIFGVFMSLFLVNMDLAGGVPVAGMIGFIIYSLPKIFEYRKTKVFVKRHVWFGAIPIIYIVLFVYNIEARFSEVKKGNECVILVLEKYKSSHGVYPDDLESLNFACDASSFDFYNLNEAKNAYKLGKRGSGYTRYEYSSENNNWLRRNTF